MPFEKGHAHIPGSGRPKGMTFRGELRQRLEEKKVDVVNIVMEKLSQINDPVRYLDLLLRFMEFCYAKPKMDIQVNLTPEQAKEVLEHDLTTKGIDVAGTISHLAKHLPSKP